MKNFEDIYLCVCDENFRIGVICVQCVQLSVSGTIHKAAVHKEDENVLMYTREEKCVATEVRYHASCKSTYVNCLYKKKSR